jgi:hypothetical protein
MCLGKRVVRKGLWNRSKELVYVYCTVFPTQVVCRLGMTKYPLGNKAVSKTVLLSFRVFGHASKR